MKKPNIIIVEGIDKSGKSAIVNHLITYIADSLLIKGHFRPYDSTEEQRQKIQDYYEAAIKIFEDIEFFKDKNIIFDRFYPSQMIYSTMRGVDDFYNPFYINMEQKIMEYPHVYIWTNPPKETITERLELMGDEHITMENFDHLNYRYYKFYESTRLYKIKLNTKFPLNEVLPVNGIKEILPFPNIKIIGEN